MGKLLLIKDMQGNTIGQAEFYGEYVNNQKVAVITTGYSDGTRIPFSAIKKTPDHESWGETIPGDYYIEVSTGFDEHPKL